MHEWSIVVPVYGEREIQSLVDHVALVAKGRPFRLIVAGADDKWTASRILRPIPELTVIEAPRGRGSQIAAGIEQTESDRVLVLHADTRLPHGAFDLMDRVLLKRKAGAFFFRLDTRSPILVFSTFNANIRSLITRVPFGDQAHFFLKDALVATGGFPALPLFEDVSFMERLRLRGIKIGFAPGRVITSDRRYRERGYWRTTLRNWSLQIGWKRGISAEELAARYRGGATRKVISEASFRESRAALIIFHRALRPGKVKTRLAHKLGDDNTLALYRAFLQDIERTALSTECDVIPFVDSRDDMRAVDARAVDGLLFWPGAVLQEGSNLGERMANAIELVIGRGYEKVILIGSDLPHLPPGTIAKAIDVLSGNAGTDIVFGPATDGGYYLVGTNASKFDRRAFGLSAWSHENVLEQSVSLCRGIGVGVGLCGKLTDFDEVGDIDRWYRSPGSRKAAPATWDAYSRIIAAESRDESCLHSRVISRPLAARQSGPR